MSAASAQDEGGDEPIELEPEPTGAVLEAIVPYEVAEGATLAIVRTADSEAGEVTLEALRHGAPVRELRSEADAALAPVLELPLTPAPRLFVLPVMRAISPDLARSRAISRPRGPDGPHHVPV